MPSLGPSNHLRIYIAAALAAASTWLAAAGCTPSAGVFCDKKCDCSTCTNEERASCVGAVADSRTAAQKKGCGSQFDALFACTDARSTCVGTSFEVGGACAEERAALGKCAPGTGIGNACELFAEALAARYQECGVQVDVGPTTNLPCSPPQAVLAQCFAACLDKLDCPCTKDPTLPNCPQQTQPYNNCVASCYN